MRNAITFPGVVIVGFLCYTYATNWNLSAPDNICETDKAKVEVLVSERNERESGLTRPSVYHSAREGIEIPIGHNRYTAWDNMVSWGPWDVGGGQDGSTICYWPTRMYFIERIAPRDRDAIMRNVFETKRSEDIQAREILEYPGERAIGVHTRENGYDTYTLEYLGENYNYIWKAHYGRDRKKNIDLWREMIRGSRLP